MRMLSLHSGPPWEAYRPVCDGYVQVSTSVTKMMLLVENVGTGRSVEGRKAEASLEVLEESEFSRWRMRRGFQAEVKHV